MRCSLLWLKLNFCSGLSPNSQPLVMLRISLWSRYLSEEGGGGSARTGSDAAPVFYTLPSVGTGDGVTPAVDGKQKGVLTRNTASSFVIVHNASHSQHSRKITLH